MTNLALYLFHFVFSSITFGQQTSPKPAATEPVKAVVQQMPCCSCLQRKHFDLPGITLTKQQIQQLPATRVANLVDLVRPGFYKASSNSPLIPIGGRPADILYVIDDMRIMRN